MNQRRAIESWVKRNDRRDVDIAAVAYRTVGRRVAVNLCNISYEGCQFSGEQTFDIGERITLTLPRLGEIKAQIRWTAIDGKVGARFLFEGGAE